MAGGSIGLYDTCLSRNVVSQLPAFAVVVLSSFHCHSCVHSMLLRSL